MNAMAMLLACLTASIVLQRAGKLPDNAPAALNACVINVALPALALTVRRATVDLLAQMSNTVASVSSTSNQRDRFIVNRWGRFRFRAFPF